MGDLVGKQLHIVLISHELSLPTERPSLPHLSLKGSPRWNMAVYPEIGTRQNPLTKIQPKDVTWPCSISVHLPPATQ